MNGELRKWYGEAVHVVNEIRDLVVNLMTTNLSRREKMMVLLFFQEFSEGVQKDLLEKYNMTEPFPLCINCGEPIQASSIEKEVTCKKCNTKLKVLYVMNTVEEDKPRHPGRKAGIDQSIVHSIDRSVHRFDREFTLDFMEVFNVLVDMGLVKVAKTERMTTGLVKKGYEITEKFRRWPIDRSIERVRDRLERMKKLNNLVDG